MTWTVPNNRKLFGKKTAEVDMQIMDLSISGALLVGPLIDVVRCGSRVPFLYEGSHGVAEVRHIRSADDVPDYANGAYYHVVFINIPSKLKELIFAHIADRRGRRDEDLQEFWNQAD